MSTDVTGTDLAGADVVTIDAVDLVEEDNVPDVHDAGVDLPVLGRIGRDAPRQEVVRHLAEGARLVRRQDIRMVRAAGLGHIGGEFSVIDVLVTLYLHVLELDPDRPDDPERDRFILSKGHCAEALYVVLADHGFFPREELGTLCAFGSRLGGHPTRKTPGVEQNTGALGHGLSLSVGTALAAKLDGRAYRVFTLLGDGEMAEGSNWEAAMAAAHYKLDNLTAIVDRNGLQISGTTESVCGLEPLADKWRAFGWSVSQIDGHDHDALRAAFAAVPAEPGRPSCVLPDTVKGKGVSFMEHQLAWHYKSPDAAQYEAARAELTQDQA